MAIIWSFYILIIGTSIVIYYCLKKTKEFKQLLEIANDDDDSEERSIWKNFLAVKNESLNIVFAYALWMLIFPAIFLELTVSLLRNFL